MKYTPTRPPPLPPVHGLPHLLDVSLPGDDAVEARRAHAGRHDALCALGWRHSLLATTRPAAVETPPRGRRARLQHMQQLAPDLIESHSPGPLAWTALRAAELLGVPAVASCNVDLPALAARLAGGVAGWPGRAAQYAVGRYLAGLYGRFDAVLVPNQGLAARLRACGVPRVEVQRPGVDCTAFNPQAHDAAWRARLLQAHGLAPATRLFVHTGRFSADRQLGLLVDALRRLGPGHVLLAIGEGPRLPRDAQVIRMAPLTDNRRLARAVASCDACVHAGTQDQSGVGVLEAMACGTPVVVAGHGGLAELVGDAGLLVQRCAVEDWAEAMHASLGHGNAVQRRAALRRAQQHDWPLVIAQRVQRYAALLRRAPAQRQPNPSRAVAGLAGRG